MIKFQDIKTYLKGTCNAVYRDPASGDVVYQDDKMQTMNITTSATLDPIRAGLGNGIACIIPSDSAVNVAASSAAFSLRAKAMQVGARVEYNAIVDHCEVITANTTTLTANVAEAPPVAPYGISRIVCYVTEVGVANSVETSGTAYTIDPATGVVADFVATIGKQYKLWYFTRRANAQVAALSSNFNPGTYHFTAQIAAYANQNAASSGDQGSRIGWLYVVVPYLKMNAVANIVGDQTTADTTDLSGQSMAYDEVVETGVCTDCNESMQAYYIFVPDNTSEGIAGLAVVGGMVDVPIDGTKQIPVKLVMQNNALVQPNYSELKYTLITPPSGTTVGATGIIEAGNTAGDCEVKIEYPKTGATKFTTVANVSVS